MRTLYKLKIDKLIESLKEVITFLEKEKSFKRAFRELQTEVKELKILLKEKE